MYINMFFREKRIPLPVSVPVVHPLAWLTSPGENIGEKGSIGRCCLVRTAHRRWSCAAGGGGAAFLHADFPTAWVVRQRVGTYLRTTAGRCFLRPKISRMSWACGRVRRAHHVFYAHPALSAAYPSRTAFSMPANSSSVRNPKCAALFFTER